MATSTTSSAPSNNPSLSTHRKHKKNGDPFLGLPGLFENVSTNPSAEEDGVRQEPSESLVLKVLTEPRVSMERVLIAPRLS